MMTLLTLLGAEKCALRLFLRLEDRFVLIFVILSATRGLVSVGVDGCRRCVSRGEVQPEFWCGMPRDRKVLVS